jgi:hypothetical protein
MTKAELLLNIAEQIIAYEKEHEVVIGSFVSFSDDEFEDVYQFDGIRYHADMKVEFKCSHK